MIKFMECYGTSEESINIESLVKGTPLENELTKSDDNTDKKSEFKKKLKTKPGKEFSKFMKTYGYLSMEGLRIAGSGDSKIYSSVGVTENFRASLDEGYDSIIDKLMVVHQSDMDYFLVDPKDKIYHWKAGGDNSASSMSTGKKFDAWLTELIKDKIKDSE